MSRTAKLADLAGAYDSGGGFGFKNRLINGDMRIDQRNAGASVTPGGIGAVYTLDRWQGILSQASKVTIGRNLGSVTPPSGFRNYLGASVAATATIGSTDYFAIAQYIEGFNVADLNFGNASATTVTLSFVVYSSVTGLFGGCLRNAAANRSYPFTYTISSANTWTTIAITIPGDTTGTWAVDNTTGLQVFFDIGTGSTYRGTAGSWASAGYNGATGTVSLMGTSGATFYITGVQLEKGSTATSFDYRPYGTELALCQRYYYRMSPSSASGMFGAGYTYGATSVIYYQKFPVNMRAASTALEQSGTAAHYGIYEVGSTVTCTSVPVFNTADFDGATVLFTASGLTAGRGSIGRSLNTAAYLGWSAEL